MSLGSIMKQIGQVKLPFASKTWAFAVTDSSSTIDIPPSWYNRQVAVVADGAAIYLASGGEAVEVDDATVTGVTDGVPDDPTGTEGGLLPASDMRFFTPRKDGVDIETHLAMKCASGASSVLRCWISDHPEQD